MKCNEGTSDRTIRLVVGLLLIAMALSGLTVWGWIGVVPLLTGAIGYCPAYSLFGFNTCPMEGK